MQEECKGIWKEVTNEESPLASHHVLYSHFRVSFHNSYHWSHCGVSSLLCTLFVLLPLWLILTKGICGVPKFPPKVSMRAVASSSNSLAHEYDSNDTRTFMSFSRILSTCLNLLRIMKRVTSFLIRDILTNSESSQLPNQRGSPDCFRCSFASNDNHVRLSSSLPNNHQPRASSDRAISPYFYTDGQSFVHWPPITSFPYNQNNSSLPAIFPFSGKRLFLLTLTTR